MRGYARYPYADSPDSPALTSETLTEPEQTIPKQEEQSVFNVSADLFARATRNGNPKQMLRSNSCLSLDGWVGCNTGRMATRRLQLMDPRNFQPCTEITSPEIGGTPTPQDTGPARYSILDGCAES